MDANKLCIFIHLFSFFACIWGEHLEMCELIKRKPVTLDNSCSCILLKKTVSSMAFHISWCVSKQYQCFTNFCYFFLSLSSYSLLGGLQSAIIIIIIFIIIIRFKNCIIVLVVVMVMMMIMMMFTICLYNLVAQVSEFILKIPKNWIWRFRSNPESSRCKTTTLIFSFLITFSLHELVFFILLIKWVSFNCHVFVFLILALLELLLAHDWFFPASLL